MRALGGGVAFVSTLITLLLLHVLYLHVCMHTLAICLARRSSVYDFFGWSSVCQCLLFTTVSCRSTFYSVPLTSVASHFEQRILDVKNLHKKRVDNKRSFCLQTVCSRYVQHEEAAFRLQAK